MTGNLQRRDREIFQFIPQPLQPACDLCHFYPVCINSEALIRRLDQQIAKLDPSPRREKLQRLRRETGRSDAVTLYLHGRKELFTFPILKAAIPALTPTNWTLVRDYIFYGPRAAPTPGLGSFFYRVADRFCSRKTMHMVVLPAIADLRLEYSQAIGEGQLAKAVSIRIQATWNLMRVVLLCLGRERG